MESVLQVARYPKMVFPVYLGSAGGRQLFSGTPSVRHKKPNYFKSCSDGDIWANMSGENIGARKTM